MENVMQARKVFLRKERVRSSWFKKDESEKHLEPAGFADRQARGSNLISCEISLILSCCLDDYFAKIFSNYP